MSPPVRLVSIVLCALLLGCGGASAQPFAPLPIDAAPRGLTLMPVEKVHAHALRVRPSPPDAPLPLQEKRPSPHFGRALLGGTFGVGIGTGTGLLLLAASASVDPETESSPDVDQEAGEAASVLALLGVAAILSGGPFGAVEMSGIDRNRRDAYIGAGIGEFVFGVIGYVIANQLHRGTSARLAGVGTGVVLGSATGAFFGALHQRSQRGLLRRAEGEWSVASPTVQLRLHRSTRHPPSVGVTLMSVRW
ncbi:hypothetical protein BSZ35_05250 [Salinibacter sp. 10B]|uniref:hypothetical protein n=1 Tax=Salinibacter sp. 10B TaxID=1923971 RepID=UPI000CF3DCAA|nr:hypothetical protein [Salinibacter sp. 10B]PQJ34089.1 hypothetical protein BSZ35_05250 [Salinibacter sp. 10B]